MMNLLGPLERYLRIDVSATKSELMRTRAVYMMGMAFIATQFINLLSMSYSYGSITVDHFISFTVCALVAMTIIGLRYSKKFQVYAAIYSVLIIAGTLSSALNQNTGINSALIPFFILGVVANGFICGWRATTAFGTTALIIIWFLWWVSANYAYTPIFDVEHFRDRSFQRATQASLATILITMMSAFFSKNMHEAFGELEESIAIAQDSDRAKTAFLATMSHELCTPMNGIVGMNEILEETDLDEEQRELTDIIRESGRGLQTIIGNVLLFSQLEADRVTLDDSGFDLRRAVEQAARPYFPVASNKRLVLKLRLSPSLPAIVHGDKLRISQIVSALLDNAIKFTDNGAVEISVRGESYTNGTAEITLSVTDTGIGIATEDQSRIFERFTQKDGSIKRAYGGTGLGLTVARDLAELMEGELTVSSELGTGSSFTFKVTVGIPQTDTGALLQAAE